jgi:hypothetical protein
VDDSFANMVRDEGERGMGERATDAEAGVRLVEQRGLYGKGAI